MTNLRKVEAPKVAKAVAALTKKVQSVKRPTQRYGRLYATAVFTG